MSGEFTSTGLLTIAEICSLNQSVTFEVVKYRSASLEAYDSCHGHSAYNCKRCIHSFVRFTFNDPRCRQNLHVSIGAYSSVREFDRIAEIVG